MTYTAIHTIGKPQKKGSMSGVWASGATIKEEELTKEQIHELLAIKAIQPSEGEAPATATLASSSELDATHAKVKELTDALAGAATQLATANREIKGLAAANADMNKVIESLQKKSRNPGG